MFLIAKISNVFNRRMENLSAFVIRKAFLLERILVVLSFLSIFLLFSPSALKDTGSWSLELLWIILFLPIFAKVFRLRLATAFMRLRKGLGILMGTLASVHVGLYFLQETTISPLEKDFWVWDGVPSFLGLGFVAFVFTVPLLLTSNLTSMKALGGKKWKLLHHTAYLVAIFTVLHVSALEWAKDGHQDIGGFLILAIYFLGKTAEWKNWKIF